MGLIAWISGSPLPVVLAIAFAVTNGLHDAANSIAALVATRAATPLQAILFASIFNVLGPLLLGAAVANTIGGIVTVPRLRLKREVAHNLDLPWDSLDLCVGNPVPAIRR